MNLTETNTHFTSDIHFQHRKIIEYSNRPFSSVEEMDEALIQNWNRVVKPDDYCFSLGDFAFAKIGRIKEILSRLNGHKHLINGNHCETIKENRRELLDCQLVDSISDYKEIKIAGQFIVLFHYSTRVWNKSHRGSWALWGHSHGSLSPHGKSVDVGVDAPFVLNGERPYRPLSYLEIKKFMDKQVPEDVDHHRNRE